MPTGFRQLEWLLRTKLRAGLQAVRDNPAYLDEMFPDLTQNSRDQLKAWFQQTEVSILLSYPRFAADLPCWTIHLVGEQMMAQPIGGMIESYRNDAGDVQEEQGEYVRKTYQLWTVAGTPDVTLVMATLLQHILKNMRQDLVGEGFYEPIFAQEDGLDLKIETLPLYTYTRVTTLSVVVEDTFVHLDTQATSVVVGHQDGQDGNGFVQVDFLV